ncbi:MAG: TlpA family protein disulfide reductase [Chitinophagaceae bacterium]|nr:TlpA family protein disulfide reductase [Chitinophagaceae bacterium]
MMNLKKIISFSLLTMLLMTASAQQIPNITDPRLQIKLPNVNGDSLSLASLKGKVLLLDFWASWCMPCRVSNRRMVKVYDKYKSQGFEIFGVSVDETQK